MKLPVDFKDPANRKCSVLAENIDYLIEVLKAYLSKSEIYPEPTTVYIDGDTVCLTAEYNDEHDWVTEDYLFSIIFVAFR